MSLVFKLRDVVVKDAREHEKKLCIIETACTGWDEVVLLMKRAAIVQGANAKKANEMSMVL